MPNPPTIDELVHLRPRMKRLALRLLRDEAAAEDAVQDAYLEAMRKRPDILRSSSGWFSAVTRTMAARIRRDERSRRRREEVAARTEATEEGLLELERRSLAAELRELVGKLADPYSIVLRLRYLDELDNEQIAARLDVPVATVRTQVHRGLARLREQLDQRWNGDRRAWMVALMLDFEPTPEELASLGVTTTAVGGNAALKWLFSGLLLMLGTGMLMLAWPEDEPTPVGDAVVADVRDARPPTPYPPTAASTSTRRRVVPPEPATVAEVPMAAFEVRVVDGNGAPLADVPIALATDNEYVVLGRTDSAGSLDTLVPQAQVRAWPSPEGPIVRLGAGGEQRALSLTQLCSYQAGEPVRTTFELDDPGVRVEGWITDQDGLALAGAEVYRRRRLEPRFVEGNRKADREIRDLSVRTDETGYFDLGRLRAEPQTLVVRAMDASLRLPNTDLTGRTHLEIRFQLPGLATVHGAPTWADGTPVQNPILWTNGTTREARTGRKAIESPFRVRVMPGDHRIWIRDGDRVAYEEVLLAAGEDHVWTTPLERNTPTRLRFVDEDGDPHAGIFVFVELSDDTRPPWSHTAYADADGAIQLSEMPAGPITVMVGGGMGQSSYHVAVVNWREREPERTVVVPHASLSGVDVTVRVAGVGDGLPPGTTLKACPIGGAGCFDAPIPEDGSEATLRLAPGPYCFAIFSDLQGMLEIGLQEVPPDVADYDLGLITLPPTAQVDVEWLWEPGTTVAHRVLATMKVGDRTFATRLLVGKDGPLSSYALWPGGYLFDRRAQDGTEQGQFLVAESGERYRLPHGPELDVTVRSRFLLEGDGVCTGVPYTITRTSRRADAQQVVAIQQGRVLDRLAEPEPIERGMATIRDGRLDIEAKLEPGAYEVRVELPGGRTGRCPLVASSILTKIWPGQIE